MQACHAAAVTVHPHMLTADSARNMACNSDIAGVPCPEHQRALHSTCSKQHTLYSTCSKELTNCWADGAAGALCSGLGCTAGVSRTGWRCAARGDCSGWGWTRAGGLSQACHKVPGLVSDVATGYSAAQT